MRGHLEKIIYNVYSWLRGPIINVSPCQATSDEMTDSISVRLKEHSLEYLWRRNA